ncbi:MAG TPA: phosphatase PAP2 family protein [Ignavibacteriaceae bacterium]|nr:phosphatase PAP2 family protein [Ignavibacteriaceae bacterium]
MTDFLYSIDLSVLYFFNHTISTGFLDKFFSTITNVNNWYIAYAILIGISWTKGGRIGKTAVIGVILLILAGDQLGHKVLKEIFQRIRPCNALMDILTPLGCTGSYSFPSNHAINNFAAAMFFYRLFPRLKWVLFITAFLVALSRVYLGLHYPSDMLGGALIGLLLGYIFAEGAIKMEAWYETRKNLKLKSQNSSEKADE